jgi:hypothetical protein
VGLVDFSDKLFIYLFIGARLNHVITIFWSIFIVISKDHELHLK